MQAHQNVIQIRSPQDFHCRRGVWKALGRQIQRGENDGWRAAHRARSTLSAKIRTSQTHSGGTGDVDVAPPHLLSMYSYYISVMRIEGRSYRPVILPAGHIGASGSKILHNGCGPQLSLPLQVRTSGGQRQSLRRKRRLLGRSRSIRVRQEHSPSLSYWADPPSIRGRDAGKS